jgi:hypothetical protein
MFSEILKTKPHNEHHLNRYIRFINDCVAKNKSVQLDYSEKHHICPKAKDMFPEFKSLKQYPWNCAVLSFRQHLIAHYMLLKAYKSQSQILSYIRTSSQPNVKLLNKPKVKFIESAKKQLSAIKKGKFTRGYDQNGIPLVSESTKKKMSEIKKEFYSDESNRIKHSIACKGSKRVNTEKFSIAAKNRSENHKKNIQKSLRETWEKKRADGTTKRVKEGIYVTPIGKFTSIEDYASYCRNPDKPFTVHSTKKNPKLNKSVIGLTPRELGFFFVYKNDLTISQYYVDLNQAHPPEPNHLLSSELNDYLSREKLPPQT